MWFKPVLDKEELHVTIYNFMYMIIQKCREFNLSLFTCFVDYTQAFDSVEHLWNVMREMGFLKKNRVANRSILQGTTICGQNRQTGLMLAKACVRAVLCHLCYFSVYTESIMREVKEEQSNSEYD